LVADIPCKSTFGIHFLPTKYVLGKTIKDATKLGLNI
jgi:hypothetical protein